LGIGTVAIYAEQDKLSLHRFKADEAYQLDTGKGPIEAYLAINDIVPVARQAGVDYPPHRPFARTTHSTWRWKKRFQNRPLAIG
jgi:pyruvate carboxylase